MASVIMPDISHHNGAIDWGKLKESAPFILIKGTQRSDFVSPTLDKYIQKCETLGIPYWIYAFLEKGNEKTQTEFLVNTCKRLIGDYFVGYALDAERDNSAADLLKAIPVLFAASDRALLYLPYGKYSTWTTINKEKHFSNLALWEPRYGPVGGKKFNPLFPPHLGAALHQFTEIGEADYISGTVDLNRLTGVLPLEWFLGRTKGTLFDVNRELAAALKDISEEFAFPARGYYKTGDGYKTNVNLRPEIRKIQRLVNSAGWFGLCPSLIVDGEYGSKTWDGVRELQKIVGVLSDGLFGPKTLRATVEYGKKRLS